MHFYLLLLGILAVWRITHLLHAENGPSEVFDRLRRFAAKGFWNSLFDCFYCLSLWVAIPFVFLISEGWRERLLLWPALSAGAILLEQISSRTTTAAPATYFEEPEREEEEEQHVRVLEDQDKCTADAGFSDRQAVHGR